jgi:hypothetical protein
MKITVVDEHHEVFLLWEEALATGRIKKGTNLLHVDAHSDLSTPIITESVYSKDIRGFVKRQLNISNFIIPAVLRGIFKEIVFLNRTLQIDKNNSIRKKQYIGTLHGKGKWINNGFSLNNITRQLYPDFKQWYFTSTNDLETVKKNVGVLDIDLDYFCGYFYQQPQIGLKLTKAQLKRLKRISLSEDKYKLPLQYFSLKKGVLKDGNHYPFLKGYIYNDSKPWIECAVRYFVDSLKIRPSLISICRSVKSGYMPERYAEFTEHTLIDYLIDRKKKKIDPCDISSGFKIYSFITCIGNTINNPLTNNSVRLKQDSRFIWERLKNGANFNQIFKDMLKVYDAEPQTIKQELIKFVFRLKRDFIIK